MSSRDCKVLAKQRQLLLEKLQDFETTNSALRRMLRDEHHRQVSVNTPSTASNKLPCYIREF